MEIPSGYQSFLEENPQFIPSDFDAQKETLHDYLSDKVIHLQFTLYGTKQAGRRWNIKINESLVKRIGFKRSLIDPCVYYRPEPSDNISLLVLHVDDGLLSCPSGEINDAILAQLKEEYELHDCGMPCRFLGMDIFHDARENSFFINCETYISILEERFNLVGTRGRHTPCSSQKLEPRSVTGEDGLGPEVPLPCSSREPYVPWCQWPSRHRLRREPGCSSCKRTSPEPLGSCQAHNDVRDFNENP